MSRKLLRHFVTHPVSLISVFLLLSVFIFLPFTFTDFPLSPQVKSVSIHPTDSTTPLDISCSSLPEIDATAIYIYDLDTDTVVCQRQADLRLFPASTTKIMTALVALDLYRPDQILTVYSADGSVGHTMKLLPHDQLMARDLLFGLLVSSGNDAALALAENHPQGYSAFVSAMNLKAQELGLTNTYFTNVSGVEDNQHYTSAADLTTMAIAGLNSPLFVEAVATQQTTVTSLQGHDYTLYTTNELLGRDDVSGVKTGWTPAAGECLVTLYSPEGHHFIITLLGSTDRFGETEFLLDWLATYL